jgi:hypothetical protein
MNSIAENWGLQDLPAALGWLQGLYTTGPTSGQRSAMLELRAMVNNLSNDDPDAAATYALSLADSDPKLSINLLGTVATNRVAVDPAAALAWAQSLPDDGSREGTTRQVIIETSNTDPTQAWNMLQQLPPSPTGNDVAAVIGRWSAMDPTAAAAALSATPTGLTNANAVGNLTQNWFKQDPAAASEFVNTLPEGDSRDAAITQLVSVEGKNNLPGAFTWATSMTNTDERMTQLKSVVTQWGARDIGAATTAVQNATLTDDQRTVLMNALNKVNYKK